MQEPALSPDPAPPAAAGLFAAASAALITPALAQRAGELLARTGGSNAVDATVIASAAQRGDVVVTGDGGDLRALARGVQGVEVADLR